MSYKTLRGALAVLAALGASAASASPSSTTSPPRVNVPEPADPPMLQSVVVPVPAAAPPPPAPPRSGKERAAVPTGNPGGWATADDYPPSALRDDMQGTTGFRLTVGIDGRVSACSITQSSGSPDLDAATCRLVTQRATFTPALDRKGKPAQGSYSNRIRWVLPEPAEPLQPFSRTESFILETNGKASNCLASIDGKPLELEDEKNPCGKGVIMAPYTGADGKPVRRLVSYTIRITITDPDTAPATGAPGEVPPVPPKKRSKP